MPQLGNHVPTFPRSSPPNTSPRRRNNKPSPESKNKNKEGITKRVGHSGLICTITVHVFGFDTRTLLSSKRSCGSYTEGILSATLHQGNEPDRGNYIFHIRTSTAHVSANETNTIRTYSTSLWNYTDYIVIVKKHQVNRPYGGKLGTSHVFSSETKALRTDSTRQWKLHLIHCVCKATSGERSWQS